MDSFYIDLYLYGVATGFLACLAIVAWWDDFHAKRELKKQERKAALQHKDRAQP